MVTERTTHGLEIALRPRGGALRFLIVPFLGVWLCGWAFGEVFALWILAGVVSHLVDGTAPVLGGTPPSAGAALAIGAFLLVWVTFWTLGGFMAIREVLRALRTEDRLIVRPEGLSIIRRIGPLGWTRAIARDAVRRVRLTGRNEALAVEVGRATIEVSSLGTRDERAAALAAIAAELGLPTGADGRAGDAGDPARVAGPPRGWEEVVTPEGEPVLVRSVATRRTQARVTAGVAIAVAAVASWLIARALDIPAFVPGAIIAALLAGLLAWGTAWLARGRVEWRIGGDRIVLRRRFGARVRDLFEGRRLELTSTRDSDGDEWYALDAVADHAVPSAPALAAVATAPAAAAPATIRVWIGTPKAPPRRGRRTIVRVMSDPDEPRRLGAWLAGRGGLRFDDLATEAAQLGAREVDLTRVRAELAKAGPLGRFAAGILDRVERERPNR